MLFNILTAVFPCFIRNNGVSGKKNNEISNTTANTIINIDIAKILTYVPKMNASKNPKFAAKIIEEIRKPRILQKKKMTIYIYQEVNGGRFCSVYSILVI